ncbi:MAG: arsenite methyltransferase [Chloroflexi bacterium]|jgi:arsenite methyltransferase|nr:arsenite methyltransferase [Chloroflexota bacterium]MBT7080813.1 arsenite methyltransferase [Chloroflexota bacterium]MBT7289708.1 arsenite methyltransferase [Chloroflexota bacterium]
MNDQDIRNAVRESYGKVATQQGGSCCGPESLQASPCCGGPTPDTASKAIGYTDEQLASLPDGADLGLGCGNPTAMASLKEGEVVLDLGSGAGIDCFLAAAAVGKTGRVIGVDMTPAMLERARENASKGGYDNVEFRMGEIEHLPVADNTVDAIISNCVINLSPDKRQVFSEAYRVLRPGGRVMLSDIVLLKELPEGIKGSVEAYVGCVAGAETKEDYLANLTSAGFTDVKIVSEVSAAGIYDNATEQIVADLGITAEQVREVSSSIISIKVQAIKSK